MSTPASSGSRTATRVWREHERAIAAPARRMVAAVMSEAGPTPTSPAKPLSAGCKWTWSALPSNPEMSRTAASKPSMPEETASELTMAMLAVAAFETERTA